MNTEKQIKAKETFYAEVKKVAAEYGLTDMQSSMLEMICEENGYDTPEPYETALSTLRMYEDQGEIILAANNFRAGAK